MTNHVITMLCAYCGAVVDDVETLIVHVIDDCENPPERFAGVPTLSRADYLDLARVWGEDT